MPLSVRILATSSFPFLCHVSCPSPLPPCTCDAQDQLLQGPYSKKNMVQVTKNIPTTGQRPRLMQLIRLSPSLTFKFSGTVHVAGHRCQRPPQFGQKTLWRRSQTPALVVDKIYFGDDGMFGYGKGHSNVLHGLSTPLLIYSIMLHPLKYVFSGAKLSYNQSEDENG